MYFPSKMLFINLENKIEDIIYTYNVYLSKSPKNELACGIGFDIQVMIIYGHPKNL